MGLFDAFSSSDENQQFGAGFRKYKRQARKGLGDINEYYGQGADALRDAEPRALDALESGVERADARYDQAAAPWNPLLDRGLAGMDSYWDILQNPDSIYDSELYRAREAAGLDQINRGYNARGMLASGNNTQDQIDYMRQFGLDYRAAELAARNPYFNVAQNAAQGLSNVRSNQARLYDQLGANKSNVITGTAGGLSDLFQRQGSTRANIRTGMGQAGSDMHTNMANAQSAADANLWGAIMGLTKAGVELV